MINWGMLPFTVDHIASYNIKPGDRLYVRRASGAQSGATKIDGVLLQDGKQVPIELKLENLTQEDREIILKGCLINYYA